MTRLETARILRQSGILLIAAALVCAAAAWLHMRALMQTYGAICGAGGGALAHCSACYASAVLFAGGLTTFGLAQTERPARLWVRRSRSA